MLSGMNLDSQMYSKFLSEFGDEIQEGTSIQNKENGNERTLMDVLRDNDMSSNHDESKAKTEHIEERLKNVKCVGETRNSNVL